MSPIRRNMTKYTSIHQWNTHTHTRWLALREGKTSNETFQQPKYIFCSNRWIARTDTIFAGNAFAFNRINAITTLSLSIYINSHRIFSPETHAHTNIICSMCSWKWYAAVVMSCTFNWNQTLCKFELQIIRIILFLSSGNNANKNTNSYKRNSFFLFRSNLFLRIVSIHI